MKTFLGCYVAAAVFTVGLILLLATLDNTHAESLEPEREWGQNCTKKDIQIAQGLTGKLPNGIPLYTVEVMNECATGCSIEKIHLSCGWFSSARRINHRIFKRLAYDDCLVNDGKPLDAGSAISFQYATGFMYRLSVSSVTCVVPEH